MTTETTTEKVEATTAKDGYWLVWSLEHGAWWKGNTSGYTPTKEEAGLFTFEEAQQIVIDGNKFRGELPPNEAMVKYY